MPDKKWVLWENDEMSLQAAYNPAIPRGEGFHMVLLQKKRMKNIETNLPEVDMTSTYELPPVTAPWLDPELYGRMSVIAAKVSAVIINLDMADWINIQYNGNVGVAKGKPFLHIHIFGRYKTGKTWGGPLQLPSGEGPYGNDPLSEWEIQLLGHALVGI